MIFQHGNSRPAFLQFCWRKPSDSLTFSPTDTVWEGLIFPCKLSFSSWPRTHSTVQPIIKAARDISKFYQSYSNYIIIQKVENKHKKLELLEDNKLISQQDLHNESSNGCIQQKFANFVDHQL